MIRHEPDHTGHNAVTVVLQPVGDAPLPHCTGAEDTPVIEWGGWPTRVQLLLGNVDDPAEYLRDHARQLLAFAHDIDAGREQRQPEAIR